MRYRSFISCDWCTQFGPSGNSKALECSDCKLAGHRNWIYSACSSFGSMMFSSIKPSMSYLSFPITLAVKVSVKLSPVISKYQGFILQVVWIAIVRVYWY